MPKLRELTGIGCDTSTYELYGEHTAWIAANGYVVIYLGLIEGKLRQEYLHRLICPTAKGEVVDHMDRNKLNNLAVNLRAVSQLTNVLNSPAKNTNKLGIKGVYFCKTKQKYKATMTLLGVNICLGSYDNLEDAVAARLKADELRAITKKGN